MRLKRKKKGGLVKLTSCAVVLALTVAMVGPEISRTFAAEDDQKTAREVVGDKTAEVENTFTVEEAINNDTDPQTGSAEIENTFTVNDVENTVTEVQTPDPEEIPVEFQVENHFSEQEDSVDVDFDFTVQEYIQITADPADSDIDVTMVADDVSPDNFTSASANFDVSSNNANGFGVYIYADEDSAQNLTSSAAGNSHSIAPISGTNLTADQFTANTWGYNVSLTADLTTTPVSTFSPIQSRANLTEPVFRSTGPSAGTKLTLTCGTKIDYTLPVDTYETDVYISAVAPFDSFINNN